MQDKLIFAAVEKFSASFKWETVELEIRRRPDGSYNFMAYLQSNTEMGLPCVFGYGDTPDAAVEDTIKKAGDREPESFRQKAIAELQLKIAKLQAMEFGLPPWQPARELGDIKPIEPSQIRPNPNAAIDV